MLAHGLGAEATAALLERVPRRVGAGGRAALDAHAAVHERACRAAAAGRAARGRAYVTLPVVGSQTLGRVLWSLGVRPNGLGAGSGASDRRRFSSPLRFAPPMSAANASRFGAGAGAGAAAVSTSSSLGKLIAKSALPAASASSHGLHG